MRKAILSICLLCCCAAQTLTAGVSDAPDAERVCADALMLAAVVATMSAASEAAAVLFTLLTGLLVFVVFVVFGFVSLAVITV